ncbi:hypothetical protein [Mesonia sp. K7]|uniref:hypothetical protein n=1 Tax=Mesonia sp. K7 TaxID=2218606 RepID=UPI000DA9F634|nr:hypothetical protein [Mesonia sp. K7]PZD79440.1 hypothetical protein DNG35_00030 [Mesonia sp. K7]
MKCLQCEKETFGRSDKKFCSPECRNEYNNERYRREQKAVIDINKTLKKNRMILKRLNPEGKIVVPSEILLKAGFDLEYFTNIYTTKNGREYRFCYDYGYYYDDEKDSYLLVKKFEEDN